jgi:hypothetical protein
MDPGVRRDDELAVIAGLDLAIYPSSQDSFEE